MKTTFLTLSVSRQGGGLFDCMRRLGQELIRGERIEVEAIGLDDAGASLDAGAWTPVRAHALPARNRGGLRIAPAMTARLREDHPDIAHTHGLWSYASVAANRWREATGGPVVISPHGMLDPWALRHSAWKKRLAALLFERRHLRGAACLHALCEAEVRAIRAYGLSNPVCVIPNGVDLPTALDPSVPPPWRPAVPAGRRVLLYLGRVHPKKGLANLLRAWATWRNPSSPSARGWTLVIAGWDQGGHAAELARLAGTLGLDGGSVHFAGPVFGADKLAAYRHADAFVLPSLSEGLPLVVLEAWSHRLPVVMTAACNLPEGFAAGAALEAGPRVEELAVALTALTSLTDTERRAMGERGRALVETRFTWDRAATMMAQVYRWLLGRGERPECVFL